MGAVGPAANTNNPLTVPLAQLGQSLTKCPRQPGVFHYYLQTKYKNLMKEEYKWHFHIAKLNWDALSEEEQAEAKKPEPVAIRTALAREFWNLESEES